MSSKDPVRERGRAMSAPVEIILHRYFLMANQMRTAYYDAIATDGAKSPADAEGTQQFVYMAAWYSLLQVVVEGWQELQLHHEAVDRLLADESLPDLLRRFRNGMFHFQKDYWSPKVVDFIAEGAASARWARDLNSAFGQFFLEWFEANRSDSR